MEEELIMMKSLYARVDEMERRIKTTYGMVAAKPPASAKAGDRSRSSVSAQVQPGSNDSLPVQNNIPDLGQDSDSGYKLVESRQKKIKWRQAVRKNQVIGTRDVSTLKIASPPIHYRIY